MDGRPEDVLLSLGSNVEPEIHVPATLDRLRQRFEVVAVSPRYRCPAVGGEGSYPDFVNLAVRLLTGLPPRALKEVCRRLEAQSGRQRGADRYAPRTMDVDVALHGARVADYGAFRVPDPQLATEAFVLVPAAEIWPDAVHPETRMTLARMRDALPPKDRDRLVPIEEGHRS